MKQKVTQNKKIEIKHFLLLYIHFFKLKMNKNIFHKKKITYFMHDDTTSDGFPSFTSVSNFFSETVPSEKR